MGKASYAIGDHVIVVRDTGFYMRNGEEGEIVEIDYNLSFPYKVKFGVVGGDNSFYRVFEASEIELIETMNIEEFL